MAAIDDILARLRHLHPLSIDLSLGRIEALLARLGNPERQLPPVIHVAGTNGKGSVTSYLKAMIEAAGRRVHVYTSPHLVRFNERISVPGTDGISRPIDEDRLAELLARVERINDGAPITFFEITTAAAFLAFSEIAADALVLEVGLGGRLDTTNVVPNPEICVITPISMDHTERLGGTLELIAGEKAGIIKTGARVVIARQEPDVVAVLERQAALKRAPVVLHGRDFDAFAQNGRLVFQGEERLLDLPLPSLVGAHQIDNAGVAVAAALELRSLALGEAAIAAGLTRAVWPARMQRLTSGSLVSLLGSDSELWLDGGHNPAGGAALAQALADLDERAPKPLWLIAGMLGNKDAAGYLQPFLGLVQGLVTVPIPGAHEMPFEPMALARVAQDLGIRAEPADGIEAALSRVRSYAKGGGRAVICGSLALAGHVLALNTGTKAQMN